MATATIGGSIEIKYVNDEHIAYRCNPCNKDYRHEFSEEALSQDWYKFTCEGCDAKRSLQLRKVVPNYDHSVV